MDKITNQVVNIFADGEYQLLTISEVTHMSVSSHDIHFSIVKKLVKSKLVFCFSSERLGFIDAFLMNKWLNNEIEITIDKLYSILLFGGLGTYRWLEYFKKYRIPVLILGLEGDYIYPNSDDTFKYLEKYTSTKFMKSLRKLMTVSFPQILPEEYSKIMSNIKKNISTELERQIYESVKAGMATFNFSERYDFWYNNIKQFMKTENKLFINGYHLSSNDIKIPKHMSIGMMAKNIQAFCVKVPKKIINTFSDTIKNNIVKSMPFVYNEMRKYGKKRYPTDIRWWKKKKNICFINKHWQPTQFENSYTNFKLIDVKSLKTRKDNSYTFRVIGSGFVPIIPNVAFVDEYPTSAHDYDYIIFIPKSLISLNHNF